MKPILLTIKGLHSFREEQTVDFAGLSGAGVFGIFGPTGSGKSSILDAMTLALYGKVERAANNTHGILNHAEDQLAVSFTFALQSGHRVSYKVERVFKRTDETKVKTALCRLIEIKDEQTVLADKANEVNKKVEELLGLTIDDFTRAVVLPQGKFAEFLSLKGAERRHMLQRLFNLEQYGDRLVKKLRRRAQEAAAKKNEMLAEQSGLGDAGEDALKQAEQQFHEANERLEAAEKKRVRAKERFENHQEIWNLQTERDEYERREKKLEERRPYITDLTERLKEAETALALEPYADRCTEAVRRKQRAEQEHELAKRKSEAETVSFTRQNEAYEAWRAHKAEQEPKLVKEEELYQRLSVIEQKLLEAKKEAEKTNAEHSKKEEEYEAASKQLAAVKDRLTRGQNRQNELKEELKAVQVTADERKKCQTAAQLAAGFQQTQEQITKERANLTTQLKNVEKLNGESESLTAKAKTEEEDITRAYQTLQTVYHMVCETERSLKAAAERAEKTQADLRRRSEEARTAALTKELSEKLIEGKPCPVCGSTQHDRPRSAHETFSPDTAVQEHLQQVEALLSEAAALSQEVLTAKVALEEQSGRFTEECPFLQSARVPELEAASSISGRPLDEAFSAVRLEWKQMKQDMLSVKEKVTRLISAHQQTVKQAEQLAERIRYEEKEADRLRHSLEELESLSESRLNQYNEVCGDIPPNRIDAWQASIDEKDRQAEECEKRIETSIAFLKEHEEEKERLQEMKHRLERERLELHYASERLQQVIDGYEQELGTAAEETSISAKLEAVRQELQLLKSKEQSLFDALKQAQQSLNDAKGRESGSLMSLRDAEASLEKAQNDWRVRSKGTGFTEPDQVKKSLLPQGRAEEMKKEIDEFLDTSKQLSANISRVTDKLAERRISEEEWTASVSLLKQAEAESGAAMEEKGAQAKAFAVMQKQHKRFKEIEAELKSWQTQIDRLDKLQSVCKGNTFVEFLAEEQLESVARDASARLGALTRQRYAILVDSEGGFVMRDDANGGVKRPVSSLSGGETFLTSLSLALALSAQIQLRGQYPLQFFFLDEGFGTLDQGLLDTVVTALEKLQSDNLSVGVISHVQELRARLPKKLIVHPSEPGGKGTRVTLEIM
ncbi:MULTISPECIES: exonuclease subunit SbcC [Bacillus amyloliquefaciens group]|uniref:exonuclease subunit SbcC n=1 Tax=Bacillus amyloliquefaciens group TaxID=1938374 RepID=UPI0007AA727A|nr:MULTISPECIES: exonuclease subunit SbcC [Bacillus amyloliquefaciens group]KZE62850.1 nuclease SbcCD subunit C [Bacillus amyloliquefaciens]MCQ9149265.1 SMC family ATPase [Bacillus amyloliquefaciens]WOH97511.1 exonuclease subunit SbcC [Bacillus amyloliquefaciens]WOI50217.1 exonuclease subunit SbcC [Bacillus amyloliquefaciens]WOI66528.1 exonuclease subunit SbcC [Bacillus amyloliquefaciens]